MTAYKVQSLPTLAPRSHGRMAKVAIILWGASGTREDGETFWPFWDLYRKATADLASTRGQILFKVFVCTLVSMCIFLYGQVPCTCVKVHAEAITKCCLYDFWDRLLLAWSSLSSPDFLASRLRGLFCLCLPSTRILSLWVLGIEVLFEQKALPNKLSARPDIFSSKAWWHIPVMPAFRRPSQQNFKFQTSMCYIGSLYFK